jgi:hypothetical protein
MRLEQPKAVSIEVVASPVPDACDAYRIIRILIFFDEEDQ